MLPAHFFKAAEDLKAKNVLGVHNSKFSLGRHAWYDPLETITELSMASDIPLLTPMIGESLILDDPNPYFSQWWKGKR